MSQPNRSLCMTLITLVMLWGCAGSPGMPAGNDTCNPGHRFFVVDHGWHTGLVVASRDLLRVLPELEATFSPEDFIDIGWGDEQFYRSPEGGIGLGARALLLPTPTVLHLVRVGEDPVVYFGDVDSEIITVTVTADGYRNLLAFIAAAFARSADGALEDLGPGLYGHSRFFRANGRYHAFYTCNTWMADAIAASGVPISSSLALTTNTVMSRLRASGATHDACR